MTLLCDFTHFTFLHGEKISGCEIANQIIPEEQDLKFRAKYFCGKTVNDVIYVKFDGCEMSKIPQGLTNFFPSLKVLMIFNSKLNKIARNDLVEYKNLEKFCCERNEIEYLPGDLFEDFKNLEYISFHRNELKVIEPNILDGLLNIKFVDFKGNPTFNKSFSIYPVYNPNATLEEVKTQILEKFCLNSQNLKIFLNNYQQKIQKVRISNQNLLEENQKMRISVEKSVKKIEKSELKNRQLKNELENEKIENSKLNFELKKGIHSDIKNFIQDENFKDFEIRIDSRDFYVHKFLLVARSPTLAEILQNNPEVENLNLVNISAEAFEIILKFIYTDELPSEDGTNFLNIFAAAGRLKIEVLKNYAAEKIFSQINVENAAEIFKLGYKYGHDELRQKAFTEIKKKYPKIDFKEEWAIDLEKLVKIIEGFRRKEEEIQKLEDEIQRIKNEFSYFVME